MIFYQYILIVLNIRAPTFVKQHSTGARSIILYALINSGAFEVAPNTFAITTTSNILTTPS